MNKKLDLEDIKKRLSLATPGPWKTAKTGDPVRNPRIKKKDGTPYFSKAEDDCILTEDDIEVLGSSEWIRIDLNDLEFITHSRQDIELLLKEIEQLRSEIDFVQK